MAEANKNENRAAVTRDMAERARPAKYYERTRATQKRWSKESRFKGRDSLKTRREHPERWRAWCAVKRAVRKGILVKPDTCEKCGLSCIPEAHHHDYSKRLEIIWLCRPCHLAIDGKKARVFKAGDPIINLEAQAGQVGKET